MNDESIDINFDLPTNSQPVNNYLHDDTLNLDQSGFNLGATIMN